MAGVRPKVSRARASERARRVQDVRRASSVPYAQNSWAAARTAGGMRRSPAAACSRSRAARIAVASSSWTPR